VLGSLVLNVANFIGQAEAFPLHPLLSRSALHGACSPLFSPWRVYCGTMEEFTQLFGNLLAFVYHCFDRIMIHGYLSGLSRPEQVVYFVRQVLGLPVVSKEVLSQRTRDYQTWVEAYAGNHQIPIEWAEKGVRKEDYVSPSAYWKNAFLKQYEKFSRFLRNELCSNNLRDFGLKKGLDHLDAVRTRFQTITDRFAGFQAQCLNVHVDFPLLQRLALPITVGSVRYPGIRIHDTRIIRLLEVLLHGGNSVGGWTAKQIHQAVLTTFQLSPKTYGLNQLRYDLRKLKGHGLLQRDVTRYAYRLTVKGVQVALLFLFFHKHLCGPLANSRFHHAPDPAHAPDSKLEVAYYKADKAIQNIVDLLAAA
jgi:hypothetical protein